MGRMTTKLDQFIKLNLGRTEHQTINSSKPQYHHSVGLLLLKETSRISNDVQMSYTTPTPKRAALLFIPLPLAAARLMTRQLSKKPVNLKNATLDKDRSSRMVLEEANMDRKTAGVTGIRLSEGEGGRFLQEAESELLSLALAAVTVGVEDAEVVEGGIQVSLSWSTSKETTEGRGNAPKGINTTTC